MAKKKKKSVIRGSWFYRIYFGLLGLCVIGLIGGCVYLWDLMSDYENTRPKYVAEEALGLYQGREFEKIYDMDTAAAGIFRSESRQKYIEYMQSYTAGKEFTCEEAFSGNEDEKIYNVQLDNAKFATVRLERSGEYTKHGNEGWKISDVTTVGLTPQKYTFTVPSTYVVSVNGRVLAQEDIEEANIKVAATGKLPASVPNPTLTRYTALSYFGEPEVQIFNSNSELQTPEIGEDCSYTCDFPKDDTIKQKYESAIVKFAKKLANYTSEDLSRSGVAAYIENDSPAMKTVRGFDNQWCPAHTGFEFKNMVTDDYYVYSDTCFSCTVSFKYIIHYRKAKDNVYDTKYTLYFHAGRKGVLLYNFTIG